MMNMAKEDDTGAKLAKIAELKELIYDMLAEGTSEAEIMGEIKDAVSGEGAESESPEVEMAEEEGGDEMSDLEKMKRDYFKPKPSAPRSGTGVFIAAMEKKQEPKMGEPAMKLPKMGGKMK